MKCQNCNEDLDGGDVYDHYLTETGDPQKALKCAKMHGWSQTNRIRISKAVIVQPEGRVPQYEECPKCLTRLTRTAPPKPGSS